MYRGFIKVFRKLREWEWYKNSEMVHLFTHLLLSANQEENNWQGVTVKRGQLITGLDSLKKDTGISTQTLRTCIARLKSTGEITSESTNKFRIITLLKYEEYQEKNIKLTSKPTSKLTNNQQSTNNQLTANKNDKELKELKENSDPFILPQFINQEVWNEFIKIRKSKKNPNTDYSLKLIIEKLNKLPGDKNEILKQSIESGWTGVFPLKQFNNNKPKVNYL